jgi:hypothetical protein
MSVTITTKNIDEYRNSEFPDVTSVRWKAGNLDETVLNNFPNLQELDCWDSLKKCTVH